MNYISLKDPSYRVDFRTAVLRGQAPGKALFYPEKIPVHEPGFIDILKQLSKTELAVSVLKPFVEPSIPEKVLRQIAEETLDFDFPLKKVEERVYVLELFHGPTLAFKDVGARFMSRCLGYFLEPGQQMTVLVATSGDTGGAVADAFFGVEGVNVVILYPKGKVSHLQELQLTTYGGNVRALAVEGTFDDCQALVKQAFDDAALVERLGLTSANSINAARWLAQQVYYYYALQQWPLEEPPVISVPSGNFGNICAGMLAAKSGLPVKHFIAACNDNDVFVQYLRSGSLEPRAAVTTVSNAMDVGNPSNFPRVLEVFAGSFEELRTQVSGFSYSSPETEAAMKRVYEKCGYVLDPHGAVAYLALQEYLQQHPAESGLFLETAHPAKFEEVVRKTAANGLQMPEEMSRLESKTKHFEVIQPDFNALAAVLR